MKSAKEIIDLVAHETDRVILFHSASGKDSIALLDLCAPKFKEVVCVFMYVVKDLTHINRYINYAVKKYPNARFIQVPHYALPAYYNFGWLGCEKRNLKQQTMASLTEAVRERTGIDWAIFGFKQTDSLNRRLMLRTYEYEGINVKSRKAYPLSKYKNKDVLEYITRNRLIRPEAYGIGQSSGTDVSDPEYLLWLKANFPSDLRKVFNQFPLAERVLFEYEYERAKAE